MDKLIKGCKQRLALCRSLELLLGSYLHHSTEQKLLYYVYQILYTGSSGEYTIPLDKQLLWGQKSTSLLFL